MKPFPFKIIHLDIEGEGVQIFPLDINYGYYFVFWRKEIPVGDLYVQKNEPFNEDALRKKISELEFTSGNYEVKDRSTSSQPQNTNSYNSDISVVICTRNRSSDLLKCLTALQHQVYKPAEIIVVDNAPDDDRTYEVTRKFPEVVYCFEPRPGLDIARNAGAVAAKSGIIAYTDDDVQPHPWWLYHINESFRRKDVMAMTGLVIAAELETESQYIFEKYWSFNRGYTDRFYDSDYYRKHMRSGPPVWEIGAGANMAFRKEVFTRIGYFDERLDVGAAGCNGDSEIWFRILASGGIIHYNPRAVAFHMHRKELHQLKRQLYSYMRGFAAAALIQQKQDPNVSYKRHLYKNLPVFYVKKLIRHFPSYPLRYRTIMDEMRGLASGVLFYYRNRRRKQ